MQLCITGEDEGPPCDVFVKGYCRVEWNNPMQERFAQQSDVVSAHGNQQRRVGEHHDTGSAPGDGHAGATDPP